MARWSSDAVGLALTDLIVAQLLPAGSPLTIAVDDTLFKRSGKNVFGVAVGLPLPDDLLQSIAGPPLLQAPDRRP